MAKATSERVRRSADKKGGSDSKEICPNQPYL